MVRLFTEDVKQYNNNKASRLSVECNIDLTSLDLSLENHFYYLLIIILIHVHVLTSNARMISGKLVHS